MFTNEYHTLKKLKFISVITMLITLSSSYLNFITTTFFDEKETFSYQTNFYSTFKVSQKIVQTNDDKQIKTLNSIEYDINSLYIDWSDIEKQREAIKLQEFEIEENRLRKLAKVKQINKTSIPLIEHKLSLPNNISSAFKGYMCLHKITATNSSQYQFLHSGNYELKTDANGILMYGNYYIVALGSYYTNYYVGSTFRITLDTGVIFDVITGDEKADEDTDFHRMYKPMNDGSANIVEFIIACGAPNENCNRFKTMNIRDKVKGDLSHLGFEGNIVSIEKLDDFSVVVDLYGKDINYQW